jgi:hypothetical protein
MQNDITRQCTQCSMEQSAWNQCSRFVHVPKDQMPTAMATCRECLEPTDVSRAERTRRRLHFLQAQSCNLSGASVPTAISNIFYGSNDMR